MPSFIPRLLAVAVLPCCLHLYAGSLSAAPLDAALDESERLSAEAKASQARIDQLDDATRAEAVELARSKFGTQEWTARVP